MDVLHKPVKNMADEAERDIAYDPEPIGRYNVGTREFNIHFVAQWLACQHPCQRVSPYLTVCNA